MGKWQTKPEGTYVEKQKAALLGFVLVYAYIFKHPNDGLCI